MSNCHLIVCEKVSHWAASLRSRVGAQRPQIVETRSLGGCEAALAEAPASLIAIEVSPAKIEEAVRFVASVSRRFPRAAVVVFLAPEVEPAGALFRECGAIDAITSVLQAPRVARLARRHFSLAPQRETTFRQLAAERMPWRSHATTPDSI